MAASIDRRAADYLATVAVPANKHGGDRKSEGRNQVDNCKLEKVKGGNDPEYLTSVIARDRPDILERMKQGAFRSVRAAGIEAGIVNDRNITAIIRFWQISW